MRSRNLFRLGVVLALAALTHTAAAEVTVPEPEYVGNIVALQGSGAVPLEKQRVANRARVGVVRGRASNVVQGAASPVRLHGENLQLVVRASTNDVDPSQVINVFQLASHSRRDTRSIETGSQGAFFGDSMAIDFLSFESERYGESSYLITLAGPLARGEYAITLDGSRDVFNLFGID